MVAGLDQLRSQLSIDRAAGRLRRLALVTVALTIGCSESSARGTGGNASVPAEGRGGSSVSLDSALAIFRVALAPIENLEHGEPSMERLVTRFSRAVSATDTSALRAIVMSRREFAYLYYPTSPYTRFPTEQEPGLAWFLHLQHSQKGATRLFNRYGGRPFHVISNDCTGVPRLEGENRLWDDCRQRIVAGGDTVLTRLFGGIYERRGRFKIFSYSNDL